MIFRQVQVQVQVFVFIGMAIFPGISLAAAAVATNMQGAVGYCHAKLNRPDAERCAVSACIKQKSGGRCAIQVSYEGPGFGAIAQGSASLPSVAIGKGALIDATTEALQSCAKQGRACKILVTWHDPVGRGYQSPSPSNAKR